MIFKILNISDIYHDIYHDIYQVIYIIPTLILAPEQMGVVSGVDASGLRRAGEDGVTLTPRSALLFEPSGKLR